MENLVITKKQVASIEWNKQQALEEAQEIMAKYDTLVLTEIDVPSAKKELAALRKVSKEINAQALAIDKELTAPVKQFREEVKEVKAVVDNGIALIDEQVKAFELKEKEERKLVIVEFGEYKDIEAYGGFNEDWLKKSWTDKKLKEEFVLIKENIDSAIKTIKLTCATNGLESDFYVEKLKVLPLDQIIERISEDVSRLTKVDNESTEVVEIPKDEKVVTINRQLKGTITALGLLKEYADKIGVEWIK